MALVLSRKAGKLSHPFVWAPERYDPRREIAGPTDSIPLGDLVDVVRETIGMAQEGESYLILDTSDAREGIVISRKEVVSKLGSTKKAPQVGDVIISRLRPYLRQVAYVDGEIPNIEDGRLVCSTEFYVLRCRERQSAAFLVPFLLSSRVQEALSASQEGGHHPRFDDSMLLSLPVPKSWVERREPASLELQRAIALFRESERIVERLIADSGEGLD